MKHSNPADSQRVLMTIFALFGIPRTLLDVGCGDGAMIKLAHSMGVDVIGVDIEPPLLPYALAGDAGKLFQLKRQFDLVLCLETAEHIPASGEYNLCLNIADHVRTGGTVVFSAALPNQDGDGHVNGQPPAHWRDLLWDAGRLSYRSEKTAELSLMLRHTAGPLAHWLPANVQVF